MMINDVCDVDEQVIALNDVVLISDGAKNGTIQNKSDAKNTGENYNDVDRVDHITSDDDDVDRVQAQLGCTTVEPVNIINVDVPSNRNIVDGFNSAPPPQDQNISAHNKWQWVERLGVTLLAVVDRIGDLPTCCIHLCM